MIRRVWVALLLAAVVFVSGAAGCDTSQPSVKHGKEPQQCGLTCIFGGGVTNEPGPADTGNTKQKSKPLYDPDAHHGVNDKTGDRSAIAKEKADNQSNLNRLCKQTPSLCGR